MQKHVKDVQVPEAALTLPRPNFSGYSYLEEWFGITLQNDNYPYYGAYERNTPVTLCENDGETIGLLTYPVSTLSINKEEFEENLEFIFSPVTNYLNGCLQGGTSDLGSEYDIGFYPTEGSTGHSWTGDLEVRFKGNTLLRLENLSIEIQ